MNKRYSFILSGFLLIVMLAFSVPLLAQTQDFDLVMSWQSFNHRQELTAGEENESSLEVRNIGRNAITGIRLSAVVPKGWTIEFTPDYIDRIEADDMEIVEVIITPAENTPDDSYTITMAADTEQGTRRNNIWLRVNTPEPLWLWVGLAAAVVLIGVFILIYRRFSR